jgi:hypothetical protein
VGAKNISRAKNKYTFLPLPEVTKQLPNYATESTEDLFHSNLYSDTVENLRHFRTKYSVFF